MRVRIYMPFFFFNDTATTEIYTLSLHDALPISLPMQDPEAAATELTRCVKELGFVGALVKDRKSTRLNSSHQIISYAVFCLKKKNPRQPYCYLRCTQRLHRHSSSAACPNRRVET